MLSEKVEMSIQSVNPRTGESFGPIIAPTTSAQVDSMIASAVTAFEKWSLTSATSRAKVLFALADAL